jgi:transcriptional regulator with XRE-family HTH domain
MLSVVKTDERLRARELRAQGWSVKEIERHLGVSRSSVSTWVRDVHVGPAERLRLVEVSRSGPLVAAARKAAAARDVRRKHQEEGRRLVRERDLSYIVGCMLYWAEGSKERNSVKFVNADPEMVVSFADFLRRHFDVSSSELRVRCNLFAEGAEQQRAIEGYWLDKLGLPPPCLRRSSVNVHSKYSQKKRANRLPYGTCELTVDSTRIVQTIYGSIQEYGGFDRPEWLD